MNILHQKIVCFAFVHTSTKTLDKFDNIVRTGMVTEKFHTKVNKILMIEQ